jgi:hypothetical protein
MDAMCLIPLSPSLMAAAPIRGDEKDFHEIMAMGLLVFLEKRDLNGRFP